MANIAEEQEQFEKRRSLMEVLEFLTRRGVSVDVIKLAMVRAGISTEVAHLLAQYVVTAPQQPPVAPPLPAAQAEATAPSPALRGSDVSSRAAELALRKLIGGIVLVGVIWGVGITLGFAVGMEVGISQGIETGLNHIIRVVGLQ